MKKAFVLSLLVPILALTMISCDADMRTNLANLMGNVSGNVYVENGLVEPNTADAEAAIAAVAAISGTSVTDDSDTIFGISVPVPEGVNSILAPQSDAVQDANAAKLANTFNSTTQTATLLAELALPASLTQQQAATGSIELFNATLKELETTLSSVSDLGETFASLALPVPDAETELTQGDILAMQLMTNLISNTITALQSIADDGLANLDAEELEDEDNQSTLLSIVDDALFVAQITEQISGAASIDFSGQLDLASFFGEDSDSMSVSRDIALTDAGKFLGAINNLAPDIIDLMGVTISGSTYTYDAKVYKSFVLNQKTYRSSIEQAMKMIKLGKVNTSNLTKAKFDTSTLIKYVLAIFFTEYDAYIKNTIEDGSITDITDKPYDIIEAVLNDNPKLGLGTLTTTDSLNEPDPLPTGFSFDGLSTYLHGKGLIYFENVVDTLLEINKINGIAQLTTALEDFVEDPDGAGAEISDLEDWFNDLI